MSYQNGGIKLLTAAAVTATLVYVIYKRYKHRNQQQQTSDAKHIVFDESLILEQLSRTSAFLGAKGLSNVRQSFVVVVGLGGVGSHAAHMLLRSGCQKLRLIDFDQVTLSSLNRHAVATHADVGTPKVSALKKHFLEIAPWTEIDDRVEMFSLAKAAELLDGKPDYVLDCIDNLETKVELLAYCVQNGINVVSSMGAGAKMDPSAVHVADISETIEDPLARATRKMLKKRGIESGIPVVYSSERPKIGLAPFSDKVDKNDVQGYSCLPDFRVRILPVLGTLPALFGNAMTSFVLLKIADVEFETRPCNKSLQSYSRIYSLFKNREEKLHPGYPIIYKFYVSEFFQLTGDQANYIIDEIWHHRSSISKIMHPKMTLTRWRKNEALTTFNVIFLSFEELAQHEKAESPEDIYSGEVIEHVERQLSLEKQYELFMQ